MREELVVFFLRHFVLAGDDDTGEGGVDGRVACVVGIRIERRARGAIFTSEGRERRSFGMGRRTTSGEHSGGGWFVA